MAMISVIIPVYNVEKYLSVCLDSVLNQTFKDLEIICINDGSKDNSINILNEYKKRDGRIVIIDKKNAGVSSARNDGIKYATGDYIHFLDADDFLDSDYYEKMINVIKKYKTDIAVSGFVTNNKYTVGVSYLCDGVANGLYDIMKQTNALIDSYIWRYLFVRDLILKNNLLFRTDLVAQEDTLFLLNTLKCVDKIAIASGTNYHYIFNPNSALNSRDPIKHKKIKENYKIGKKYRRDFAYKNGLKFLWLKYRLLKIIKCFRG